MAKAEFSQSRNDLYWKIWADEDKFIRWVGYDDGYWWNNISTSEDWQTKIGSVTGCYSWPISPFL